MKSYLVKIIARTLIISICALLAFPDGAAAQKRDYLTTEEIELVRDAQEIDQRINVLIKTIDRRIALLNQTTWQPDQKESDKWGKLPVATSAELLSDISKILQKAIDDIDDLAARRDINDKVIKIDQKEGVDEETARLIKSNNKNFSLAVHNLADASRQYIPILEEMGKKTKDKKEQGSIYGALESCSLIIDASTQIEKPVSDKKKKDKGN